MTNTKEELRRMMQGIRHDLELAFDNELKSEDGEPVAFWEYLADGLALGGPNIWVDTETDSIYGAWGSDREEVYISSELSDAILESMTLDWDCY